MASDEALRRFYSDDDDSDGGMYAYHHYFDDGQDDAGRDEEGAPQQPVVRRKKAADRRAPRGPLRSVRRRSGLPTGCGDGAGPWGGKQRRKLLAWRLRWKVQRRQVREKARWSGVKAPPGLLDPIFLDLEIHLGDD